MRLEREKVEMKEWFRSAQADIERLENENLKFQADAKIVSRNIQECQQKLKESEERTRAFQVERDNLEKELSEAMEEASVANGGVFMNLLGLFTTGSSKDKVKSIIKSQRQQLTDLGSALERLTHDAHELEMAKREVEKRLEKQIQTHQVTVKSFEDDLDAWRRSSREHVQELEAQLIREHQQVLDKMHQMQNFCDDYKQRVEAQGARTKETLMVSQEEVKGLTVHYFSYIIPLK